MEVGGIPGKEDNFYPVKHMRSSGWNLALPNFFFLQCIRCDKPRDNSGRLSIESIILCYVLVVQERE